MPDLFQLTLNAAVPTIEFSRAMRKMRASMTFIKPGRPTLSVMFVHLSAINLRSQRIKVSGVTIVAT